MNITHPQPGAGSLMNVARSQIRNLTIAGSMLLLAFAAYLMISGWKSDDLTVPNEKAVAVAMLAKTFSGPRYFQHTSTDPDSPAAAGEVDIFITATSASAQEQRIIDERHFDNRSAAKLRRLIDKLTESPPSRLFNDRINLVRLNLALDALQ